MKHWWIVIALVVLAAVAYVLFGMNDVPTKDQAVQDGNVTVQQTDMQGADRSGDGAKSTDNAPRSNADDDADAANQNTQQAFAGEPLPANDLPLSSTFDDLKRMALQGNRKASCRLVQELTDCFNAESQKAGLRIMERSLMSQENPPDHLYKAVSSTQDRIAQMSGKCGELNPDQLSQSYDMQKLAADQGIPALQIRYLNQPMLVRQRFLNDLEGWKDYKDHAPQVAERLLRQGYPQAAIWLARTHMPQRQIQDNLAFSLPDKDKAATYTALAHLLYEEAGMSRKGLPDYPEGMDDADIAAAESRAESMRAQHFHAWQNSDKQSRHKISYPNLNCNEY